MFRGNNSTACAAGNGRFRGSGTDGRFGRRASGRGAPPLHPASSSSPTAPTAAFRATFHPGEIPITRRSSANKHRDNMVRTTCRRSWFPLWYRGAQFVKGRGVRVSAGPLCGPSPNSGYSLAWPPRLSPTVIRTNVGQKFVPPPQVTVLTVPSIF